MTSVLNQQASAEIFTLAAKYGLADAYANAPGSRIGEYVGIINGSAVSCVVYDRDPSADLRALRAAISSARKVLFKNGQVLSEVEQ
jgi:hypothetical protein